MSNNAPVPGWYLDPGNRKQLRWWDGQGWTDHVAPKGSVPPPGGPITPPPSGPVAAPAGQHTQTQPDTAEPVSSKKPWYFRWWAITAAAFVALAVLGSLLPEEDPPGAEATTSETATDAEDETADAEPATASETATAEAEAEPPPVDTDGDGVVDDEDFRPEDPKVQTEKDVDTDKDGVPDFKDDFPKNAKYSKDTDGDGVADSLDDFPKDERYSKDSDGDGVADSEDDFPADPSRSKITAAMQNAIGTAESYLDYTAFSRTGLIEQLEFEGYETADATFAVDYLKVNWSEQAVKSAESYLDYTTFSLSGLIDQLQFEGFTYEQAAYGANKAYK